MSIFDPQDPTEGNRRRQALLQRLMGQMGGGMQGGQQGQVGAAGRGGGFKPLQGLGGLRAFRNLAGLARAPMPRITAPMNLSPQMQRLVGPGGSGTPGQGDYSQAPGVPIPPSANPYGQYNPNEGAQRSMDLSPQSPFGPPPGQQGQLPLDQTVQSQVPTSPGYVPPPMQDPYMAETPGLIPLGGGAYYDPTDEAIRGGAGVRARTGGSVRSAYGG